MNQWFAEDWEIPSELNCDDILPQGHDSAARNVANIYLPEMNLTEEASFRNQRSTKTCLVNAATEINPK